MAQKLNEQAVKTFEEKAEVANIYREAIQKCEGNLGMAAGYALGKGLSVSVDYPELFEMEVASYKVESEARSLALYTLENEHLQRLQADLLASFIEDRGQVVSVDTATEVIKTLQKADEILDFYKR